MNIVGDHAGGLWVLGADGIVHLKDGVVTSHVQLEGRVNAQTSVKTRTALCGWCEATMESRSPFAMSTSTRSSATAKRMEFRFPRSMPFWQTGTAVFGSEDRLPLSTGMPALSEMYPIKGLKADMGAPGVMSLARGPDGSVWVGIFSRRVQGEDLQDSKDGAVRSFVTPTFDGRSSRSSP